MAKSDKKQKPKFTSDNNNSKFKEAEKLKFKRFAKAARKVGLLVNKRSYIRYFRDTAATEERG